VVRLPLHGADAAVREEDPRVGLGAEEGVLEPELGLGVWRASVM
jgi:hypothetical protein